MSKTLNYYNDNAERFVQETANVDISKNQKEFLKYIPDNGTVLDFGCGSGRDAKYFLEQGYHVEAVDGSETMCRLASLQTGIPVKCMRFEELDAVDIYDGIWACASILHLARNELITVLYKMCRALKKTGILYVSFKYGSFEGERKDRYFTDFTEESFAEVIAEVPELTIEKQWITNDARPDRSEEKWLNLILKK